MAIPSNKKDLVSSISVEFGKLSIELKSIPSRNGVFRRYGYA